jgi:hypothetical protein
MTDQSAQQQRHQAFYNNPPPDMGGIGQLQPDRTTADMVVYIAHQLFHIRKALEKIADRK